jgi:hypothetical protein
MAANYPNNVDRLAIVPLSQHSSTGQVRDSRIVAALEFQLIVATKASDGMFGCNVSKILSPRTPESLIATFGQINVVDAHLNIRKVATSDALLLYENIKLWRADHPDEPFPLSTGEARRSPPVAEADSEQAQLSRSSCRSPSVNGRHTFCADCS